MMLGTIILAAGKGTRMKSELPKVLHPVAGKPMIRQVLDVVEQAEIGQCYIVLGHGAHEVKAALGETDYEYPIQRPQLGTGHGVMQAVPYIPIEMRGVLVVCGDTPLLRPETLAALKQSFLDTNAACTVLTTKLANPTGYGRILRDEAGNITGIVEEKDATPEQKQIQEVNTGTYFFDYRLLTEALYHLNNDNAQNEYYLTDTLAYFVTNGHLVRSVETLDADEVMGVNDRISLAKADLLLRRRKNQELMANGVTLMDPDHCYIDLDVQIGADTVIYPNCHLRGQTRIGKHCVIDADCQITNSTIGHHCNIIKTVMNEATVGNYANIGPFAYLRPGATLADHVKIGDFVEVKKSTIGEGSKLPHLSYIGDAAIGCHVNIGCGTITCNYDGAKKHPTNIGDHAFIGSNTNLVAPVSIGEGAFVAAGSTITQDVEADALGVARGKQRNIPGWAKLQQKKSAKK